MNCRVAGRVPHPMLCCSNAWPDVLASLSPGVACLSRWWHCVPRLVAKQLFRPCSLTLKSHPAGAARVDW